MTADLAGQAGEEFHGIWHALVDVQLGAARQRSMSIIARQFWFARAVATRARIVNATIRCHPLVASTASLANCRAAIASPPARANCAIRTWCMVTWSGWALRIGRAASLASSAAVTSPAASAAYVIAA